MQEIADKYWPEIKDYCAKNNLDAAKVSACPCVGNETYVELLVYEPDSERAKLGMVDDKPMDVALGIFVEDGKLRFERTEYTDVLSVAGDRVCMT